MKIKQAIALGLCLFSLTACGNLDKGVTNTDKGEKTESGSITTGRVDNSVYQAIMPDGQYQTSASRETVASLNSGYNQTNYENGLLRLSHETFSPDKYFFQEGQKLDYDTLKSWLGRNTDDNNQGLNPGDESQPIILQQILEHDFVKEDGKTLGGISLGFAFNSVYYNGDTAVNVSREEIMANARKSVNAVLTRLRKMEGLENVPIVVGLFEQASKENIAGGTYIYKAVSKDGGTTIDKFDKVDEEVVSLPVLNNATNAATDDGLATKFSSFRTSVQNFFPNLTGVTGTAVYVDGQLQTLSISVDSKYYAKTEITSFTQYIGKQVESVFKDVPGQIEVQILSVNEPQAFVARKAEQEDIISYIFN
ncbi:CamS family sex pheromone protein [Enterococcus asini]|uniref:CamS family sex pheromone protein n=1 Tax=Enterococcus asini TaxID=57732 RepID=UPI000E4AD16D|nr:CamS family sex pheromone protein [Enterococcus asini]RGW11942.1 CamS family sex pheromone protein [Enterococcus asini]